MASKANASSAKSAPKREATVKSAPARNTPARNTDVPPKARSAASNGKQPVEVTREMIAERAYHLWQAGAPGGEFEHWCAAERELRVK